LTENGSSGFYFDDGSTFSGVLSVTGNIWTATGKYVIVENQYLYNLYKSTFVLAPDLASATTKEEISPDGKTWRALREGKGTKAKPATKE
jgi:hypothetical protein